MQQPVFESELKQKRVFCAVSSRYTPSCGCVRVEIFRVHSINMQTSETKSTRAAADAAFTPYNGIFINFIDTKSAAIVIGKMERCSTICAIILIGANACLPVRI